MKIDGNQTTNQFSSISKAQVLSSHRTGASKGQRGARHLVDGGIADVSALGTTDLLAGWPWGNA